MNTLRTTTALDAHALNRLHDRAHAEASALRNTAIAQFWRVSYTVLRASFWIALGGLKSLTQRLGRGAQAKASPAAPCMGCGAA